MNLSRICLVASTALVLLVAAPAASAQSSVAVKAPVAATKPQPKFNGLPEPVRATFRAAAAGGRVVRITPMGYFYFGDVITASGQRISLRVRVDGSIRSQR